MARPGPQPTRSDVRSGIVAFVRERYLALDTRWLGIFRLLFGSLLMVEVLRRWAEARVFYSNDGVLPNHYALYRPLGSDVFSIYNAFSTYGEVSVAFALTLIVFLLFTVGYKTRLFHLLSLVCITSLDARNIFLANGGTIVVNVLALWTLFLPLGRRLSIDAVLRSLRDQPEHDAGELNAPRVPDRPFVSLATLALILQWSVIYFFNTVHKNGVGWKNGTALHWFWHQDRIVTWLSVWARENVPLEMVRALTWSTLAVEGALAFILLVPFWQTWLRRIALLLALGLHGGIALSARLGPFSYVMVMFFVLLLSERDWQLLGRWFGRASRARSVVYDADCGICFQLCRLLRRLDPFDRLTFIANDDPDRVPSELSGVDLDRTLAVAAPDGRAFVEERAVYEVVRALPFGIALVWWLRVPGLGAVARSAYRWVADNRMRISGWFGLGVCGAGSLGASAKSEDAAADPASDEGTSALAADVIQSEPEADELDDDAAAGQSQPARDEPEDDAAEGHPSVAPDPETETEGTPVGSTLRGEARSLSMVVRESAVALLMIALGSQLLVENRFLHRFVRIQQPEWMAHVVRYPRVFQGWSMFAPEPPYEDGHLVVDGRTADGKKLDPLTGKPPDFDPYTPTGWGLSQFWCDFENRISFPGNAHYRQHLRNYLLNVHLYDHSLERLVAFDVWWVWDLSPPPGQLRGKPLPPKHLLSYGRVSDPGAQRVAPLHPEPTQRRLMPPIKLKGVRP